MDLSEIAARLDADEKLNLVYRFPVRSAEGDLHYETRTDKLLDVAEDARLFYVSHRGEVIWIRLDEALEVKPADAA